jgi:DNA-binding XRE family transcriptional regulator
MRNEAEETRIFTVRQARKHADFTQLEMANALGVDRTTYFKWERRPSLITVPKAHIIARLTGIPFDQIFFNDESTESREEASNQ